MAMANGTTKGNAKVIVNFSYGDWPMTLEVADITSDGLAVKLGQIVKVLDEAGATPAAHAPTTNAAPAAPGGNEPPICEYHGPMKASTKAPGTFYCPQKMGDGSYCKSKA